jgi:nucleoside-diphosphate-sugar epimerase
MSTLFCFGLSYTAAAYIAQYGRQFERIAGTVRTAEKAERLTAEGIGGHRVEAFVFGNADSADTLSAALKNASLVIVSIPPGAQGDPALALYADMLRNAAPDEIVYLSTVGVYGDHGGGWVDEMTPPNPVSPRSTERLTAERQWQAFGESIERPLAIFRLPGIYGPGRNPLISLVRGEAKRIVKPGQVFNRIHVDDIAQAIEAAHIRHANGIFNICDDEPSPGQDVIAFAAELLDMAPPPELDFETIRDTMSPMARSFYGESKRVRNTRMKDELGVALACPTYREGLRALYEAGAHQRAAP